MDTHTIDKEKEPLNYRAFKQNKCLLAGRKLPCCRADLFARQPSSAGAFKTGDIKAMLLGHWGTTPGQNFIYVHLNRLIKKHKLNMIYISGPGMARLPL